MAANQSPFRREQKFGGSKTSEGAKSRREQKLRREDFFEDGGKHICSLEGGAYVYLEVPTKGVVWEGVLERVLRDGKPCLIVRGWRWF